MKKHKNWEAKLTPKQKLFCQHYMLCGGNATAAARAAGCSNNAAGTAAQDWLQKPQVIRELAKLQHFANERYKKEMDRIIEHLVNCATVEPGDIFTDDYELKPISEMPQRAKIAFNGLKKSFDKFGNECIEFQTVSKATVFEMILKIKGLYAPTKTESNQTVAFNTDALYGKPPAVLEYAEQRILEVEALPSAAKESQ